MPKYSYRINGQFQGLSSSGNAVFAIANKIGSGKKININSVEIYPNSTSVSGGAIASNSVNIYEIIRCAITNDAGISLIPASHDTTHNLNGILNSLVLGCNAGWTNEVGTITRLSFFKNYFPGSIASTGLLRQTQKNGRFSGVRNFLKRNDSVDNIKLNTGETVALVPKVVFTNQTARITYNFRIIGSPNRTYSGTYFTNIQNNQTIFHLKNNSASVVEIISLGIEEVGTFDTQYFQLVPVGNISPTSLADETKKIPALKMDTAYPNHETWMNIVSDVTLAPSGVPIEYISAGSAGNPKGFNYLGTKDFNGPVYRTYFPEYNAVHTSAAVSNLHYNTNSMKYADVFGRRAGITIREGEGIAFVSAAETAVTSTEVGLGGWASFEYAIQFTIDNTVNPVLSLTGLQTGTEVRIMQAGTDNELTGAENVTGGSFSWLYDFDQYQTVDIHIHHLQYQFIRLENFSLTATGSTVPIQQIKDRNYQNL